MISPRPGAYRWLGIVSAVFFTIYLLQTQPVGQRIDMLLTRPLALIDMPVVWLRDTGLWLQNKGDLQQELLDQRKQTERQAAIIQQIHILREENRQLRGILGIGDFPNFRWQAARVHARTPEVMSQRLLVQVNEANADDIVVSSEGLVGVVDQSDHQFATIRTLLDASLSIPVTIEESNLSALVRGQGDKLRVSFVPWQDAPKRGDVLRTSGAGGLFPAGIPVARILKVQQRQGTAFAEIEAQSVAHWQRDAWLAVISRPQQTD
ncbi:MAG: rod shape-determining protein MreC [Mariprofundaceae bacterium]